MTYHISALPGALLEPALEALNLWFEGSEHEPTFRIVPHEGLGNVVIFGDIMSDDATVEEAELATAICFGYYFGYKAEK